MFKVEFLDVSGDPIGDESRLISDVPLPLPAVGEVVTAPRSGFFEVTSRVFAYACSAGELPSLSVKLYCRKTDRKK